jgi:hypothetical protein
MAGYRVAHTAEGAHTKTRGALKSCPESVGASDRICPDNEER